ncbi:hypothetical protein MSG28_004402 [Choristoneura fumiferana]|uniref:Uncharacterized protein n=1 Tax=Choristoneura fumiferana TaxID=7141 RepID=A0ACC0KIX8_CHOFU|nr:hypothetical protein MSG28_004402 [Choristoneura fumiferana]
MIVRKLIVCHYKKGTEICNYSYSNTILAVKLNRSRLVVCLEESLHIHNIRDMKILHTIRDTPPNPRGLCALAPAADRCLLAYPGSSAVGEVQIFDAVHLTAACVLSAHESGLAALAWSACGRRLATASERGTVIRVFAVPERARLFELRRGVKRCVTISCLAFSACGALLAAASNTETVHVFRLQDTAPAHAPAAQDKPAAGAVTAAGAGAGAGEAEGGGWLGWLSSAVAAGAGLLPAHVADVLAQGRAFAVARLPQPAMQPQVAFTNVGRAPRLLVATHDGLLLVFALDAAEGGGGDCALLRTHRLLEPRAPPAPHPHPHPHMPDEAGFAAGPYGPAAPPAPHILPHSPARVLAPCVPCVPPPTPTPDASPDSVQSVSSGACKVRVSACASVCVCGVSNELVGAAAAGNSYAGALRGRDPARMTGTRTAPTAPPAASPPPALSPNGT